MGFEPIYIPADNGAITPSEITDHGVYVETLATQEGLEPSIVSLEGRLPSNWLGHLNLARPTGFEPASL